MNYIQITIPTSSTEQKEILIALLENIGFESFEEKETSLEAYIKETEYNRDELESILHAQHLSFTVNIIPQQNWNTEWEKNFEPIKVGNFAGVRAGFHQPLQDVQHEIIITPKMSFGTGHHATTWLMLQAMEHIDFKNKSVFDFGTGTGILAILAQKLGAVRVLATDNDDWCIENAAENAAINLCNHIAIQKNEKIPAGKFDILLANINFNIIVQYLPDLANACNPGAQILFSGLLITDEPEIKKHILNAGITPIQTTEKVGWICIYCKTEQEKS